LYNGEIREGDGRMLSLDQKKLVLDVLRKERRSLFSKHKGKLLEKTIGDLAQMIRNEEVNAKDRPKY
jgi:hypothetical protein